MKSSKAARKNPVDLARAIVSSFEKALPASPLAGWALPEAVTLRSSATMRQEFA